MSGEETFSVRVIEWGVAGSTLVVYQRSAFEEKTLLSGFVSKDDGLYYEGTFEPGQSRHMMPLVNKALAQLLGVDT